MSTTSPIEIDRHKHVVRLDALNQARLFAAEISAAQGSAAYSYEKVVEIAESFFEFLSLD